MAARVRTGRLGYDLEYAVYDPQLEHLVPAGLLDINGVKGDPEKLVNGGVEIDCCAVEITPPPATTEDEFTSNILKLKQEVQDKYPMIRLVTRPSHRFPLEVLENTRYAMTMGCDPDFNAWTGRMNSRPRDEVGLRSFGGHVHIEYGSRTTIKACDLTAGMWSVLMDDDKDRRGLYGKAGAYRTKPYGVEYRVLSNFWCGTEKLIRECYTIIRHAQSLTAQEVQEYTKKFGGPEEVQNLINLSDRNGAKKVFECVMGA